MNSNTVKRKLSKTAYGIWLLIGIVFAMSLGAMIVSKSASMDPFLDIGHFCEMSPENCNRAGFQIGYKNPDDPYLTVLEENGYVVWSGIQKAAWKNWSIEVSDLNRDTMSWEVEAYNENLIVGSQTYELQEGKNRLVWDGEEFTSLVIKINNQADLTYRIDEVIFSEYPITVTMREYLSAVVGCFLIYLILFFMGVQIWKKRPLKEKECFLDYARQSLFTICYQKLHCCKDSLFIRKSKEIQILCIFLWITFYNIMNAINVRNSVGTWHYVINLAAMLMIALTIKVEEKMKFQKNSLSYAWVAFWGMVCISDFFVTKLWGGVGYLYIFVAGYLYFLWNNQKRPEQLLESISIAVHLSFVTSVIFCFFTRPFHMVSSYNGISNNSNAFAVYLILVAGVCLSSLENVLRQKKMDMKLLLLTMELIEIIFFLWKAQGRTAILTVFTMGLVWIMGLFLERKKYCYGRKKILILIISVIILFIPISAVSEWSIANIPNKLHTEIIFPEEEYLLNSSEQVGIAGGKVYAAEKKIEQRFQAKSLDGFLAGRLTIWKTYLKNMNLFGHYDCLKISGVWVTAHNSILTVGYQYGVFAIVPYLILWIACCVRALRLYRKKEWKYHLLPLLICIGYCMVAFVDAQENPWRNSLWIVAYLVIGVLFDNRLNKEEE